ncbi:MAG: MmpS family transport accessory protein [Mycobacterium sp.]
MIATLRRAWIPLLIVAVIALAGAVVHRLHGLFGSDNEITRPGALVVRSFMLPTIAALLGRWFWWPQNVPTRPARSVGRHLERTPSV